jgi:predicted ATPase/DNA-binding winged helix-turn-helix (wHTH) protein
MRCGAKDGWRWPPHWYDNGGRARLLGGNFAETAMIGKSIKFGPFELSPERHLLLKDGKPVRLGSRAIEILIVLVQHAGCLVRHGELIAYVWPGITVEDSNLRVHLGALRRALGDGHRGTRYILTDPGRGYRFVGELCRDSAQIPDAGIQAKNERPIQLPALLTRLVGRDKEIESVVKQLCLHRLVTIVGPGGIGKSSVGLAAAWDLAAGYPDGCVFVDLATLVASGLVASTMATLMQLPVRTATPLPALVGFLGDKRLLLVLDSCEHLVEEVAMVAESILRSAPHVDILATSREPLRIEGEWLQRLRPLATPPTGGDMTAAQALTFPAILLFAERALANIDTFNLIDAEAPLLAVLCQKLDGIPLAIELAAARIDSLGIKGLVAGLDDRLSLLSRGRRTALPRQRTLRATLDWSYGLLTDLERTVFCRLSIFNGPFSSTLASNVCGDSHVGPSDVQEAILNLATKSLITTDVSGDTILYRLLDTTRAYAKELLGKSPQRSMVARRHAEALCGLLKAVEGEQTDSPGNPDRRVIDDVRAALEWAFCDDGDVVIAVNLTALSSNLWFHFSLLEENKRRIERALAILGNMESADTDLEIQLRVAYGHAVWHTTVQADSMEASFSDALRLAERSKCARLQLLPLWHLWNARNLSGNYASSFMVAKRFGRIADKLEDSANILTHERMLGLSSHYLGKHQIARSLVERVLSDPATMNDAARKREFQFDQRVAARSLLARTLWVQGFPDQALRMVKACIEDAIAIQHDMSLCYAIIQSGCPVCAWAGDLQTANSFLATLLESSTKWSVLYWSWWAKSYKIVFASIGQADMISAWAHHVRELTFIPLILETIGTLRADLIDPRILPTAQNARDTGWATPELLRGSGETCLRSGISGREQDAENRFRSAFDMARQQGALSWELRAATSLARLWQTQGRRDDARNILRRTFSRFSEGFGTADLRQASLLLEELDNHPRTRAGNRTGLPRPS